MCLSWIGSEVSVLAEPLRHTFFLLLYRFPLMLRICGRAALTCPRRAWRRLTCARGRAPSPGTDPGYGEAGQSHETCWKHASGFTLSPCSAPTSTRAPGRVLGPCLLGTRAARRLPGAGSPGSLGPAVSERRAFTPAQTSLPKPAQRRPSRRRTWPGTPTGSESPAACRDRGGRAPRVPALGRNQRQG